MAAKKKAFLSQDGFITVLAASVVITISVLGMFVL